MPVVGQHLCRDHQDRDLATRFAQGLGEPVAVEFRHHDVEDDQVDMHGVEPRERRFPVVFGKDGIVLALKHGADQFSRVFVVVDDQNVDHIVPSLSFPLSLYHIFRPISIKKRDFRKKTKKWRFSLLFLTFLCYNEVKQYETEVLSKR